MQRAVMPAILRVTLLLRTYAPGTPNQHIKPASSPSSKERWAAETAKQFACHNLGFAPPEPQLKTVLISTQGPDATAIDRNTGEIIAEYQIAPSKNHQPKHAE